MTATLRAEVEPLERGTQLQSIHQLQERFGVAYGTVAKVLKTLKDEGLIVGRQGYGTFRA